MDQPAATPSPRRREERSARRSSQDARPRAAQYIYGVIATPDSPFEPALAGLEEAPVRLISQEKLTAVVSELGSRGPLRVLRKNLAPHYRVLTEFMKTRTIVPLRFGHVAASPKAVLQFLSENRNWLARLVADLHDCREMSLRVRWDSANPFEQVVKRHPDLARLRDDLFGGGRQPGRDEKLELGRAFDACLKSERERQERQILGPLRGVCRRHVLRAPAQENVLLDAALLVPRDGCAALEDRLQAVASTLGPEFLFELGGPYPPFSFATPEASPQ